MVNRDAGVLVIGLHFTSLRTTRGSPCPTPGTRGTRVKVVVFMSETPQAAGERKNSQHASLFQFSREMTRWFRVRIELRFAPLRNIGLHADRIVEYECRERDEFRVFRFLSFHCFSFAIAADTSSNGLRHSGQGSFHEPPDPMPLTMGDWNPPMIQPRPWHR